MKSSSTSSIPSSSSVTCLDTNAFASDSVTSGCLVGFLRRILSSVSLQTHPSHPISDFNSRICKNQQDMKWNGAKRVEAKDNSPGLVARLMGLDSMPKIESFNTQMATDAITRSLSMNSFDYYKEETDPTQQKHTRVRSSFSFPAFIELEDENFFILSFENESKSREFSSRQKICETSLGESKPKNTYKYRNRGNKTENHSAEKQQRKIEERKNKGNIAEKLCKQRNMEDRENNMNALNSLAENHKPAQEALGCVVDSINSYCSSKHEESVYAAANLRKNQTEGCVVDSVANERGSDDSSPISVLDFDRFIVDGETLKSAEKGSRMEESKPRKRLSPELDAYQHNHSSNEDDWRIKKIRPRIEDGFNHSYSDTWNEIFRITETEIVESEWVGRRALKSEDFEEINQDVESQILDQLLEETVDQLVDF